MRNLIFWLATIVVFVVPNVMIWNKEKLREHGQTIYLRLAPVDPRSLIQGDYMILDYDLSRSIDSFLDKEKKQHHADGWAVVTLNPQKVAHIRRIHRPEQALQAGELLLYYRYRKGRYRVGTNAFFFQEGHAKVYERARYGKYKLDTSGKTLLIGLCDDKFQDLKPKGRVKRS